MDRYDFRIIKINWMICGNELRMMECINKIIGTFLTGRI